MIINNNYPQQTSFGEKYPVERLLSCACDKPFIRKSDSVNLMASMNKLRKNEIRDVLRYEDVFQETLKKTGEYILAEVPTLKLFVKKLNTTPALQESIIEKAISTLGDEIDIKNMVRTRKPKIEKESSINALI